MKEKVSGEIWRGEISKTSSISQEKVDLGSGGLGKGEEEMSKVPHSRMGWGRDEEAEKEE